MTQGKKPDDEHRPPWFRRVAAQWPRSEGWVTNLVWIVGAPSLIALVLYAVLAWMPRASEKLSAVGENILPWAIFGVGLVLVAWMVLYLRQAIPLIVMLGGLGYFAMEWPGAFVGLCVAVVCSVIRGATQGILASLATLAAPPCKRCGARPAWSHWGTGTGTELCVECHAATEEDAEE